MPKTRVAIKTVSKRLIALTVHKIKCIKEFSWVLHNIKLQFMVADWLRFYCCCKIHEPLLIIKGIINLLIYLRTYDKNLI